MERWRWAGPGGAHVVQRSRAGRCPGTVGRDKTVSFMLLCRAGAGVRLKGCALVPQLSYTRGPGARARYRPIQGPMSAAEGGAGRRSLGVVGTARRHAARAVYTARHCDN